MIVTFMITIIVLAISLYGQAWLAARKIRRHRILSTVRRARSLMLGSRT